MSKQAELRARFDALRAEQAVKQREALVHLRDLILARAVQSGGAMEGVLLLMAERVERVMCGDGDSDDLYMVQSRLDQFMPGSGITLR